MGYVAVLAVVVGVINLAWTFANRRPGGLDVDEVTHLAHAFHWLRLVDPSQPTAVVSAVFDQEKGPLTMLVSVVALLLGPNTVGTAFAASVVLHGVSAVAVAGIAKRLSGAGAALVAGLVALALPAAIVAARSYQLAPALAATLTLAVWSLLASDRGRRLVPMLAFGASVGLMLLSRTMAVSFLPGLGVAAVVHLDRSRVAIRNLLFAGGLAAALALPWWIAQWEWISEYLLGHGYGDAAAGYGPSNIGDRALLRWDNISQAVGPILLSLGVVAIVTYLVRSARRPSGSAIWSAVRSNAAVVWITVVFGFVALMTTANLGMFFELPLLVLAVPGVVGLAAQMPAPMPRIAGGLAVVVSVITIGSSIADTGGHRSGLERTLFIGLANYQQATTDAEPELGSSDREVRLDAMDSWWAASSEVVRQVDAVVDVEPATLTICGSGPQISSGTFSLASELDHRMRESWWEWLSTSTPQVDMEERMRAPSAGAERIVVIIESESVPFPGEEHVDRCVSVAESLGWRSGTEIDLPDGGTAVVMVHPDRG